MENELKVSITEYNELDSENFFKLDFKGQSLKSNKKFEEWKKKMRLKHGKNEILYYCQRDNLYFYGTFSYDGSKCPLCTAHICYFCKRSTNISLDCCPIGRVYWILTNDALYFFKKDDSKYEYGYGEHYDFCDIFLRFLLPLYPSIYLVGYISFTFYYGLYYPEEKDEKRTYYFEEDNIPIYISIFINALIALILSLIFFIHIIFFKVLILVFSIFPMFYPIRYYLGILKLAFEQFK